MSKRSRDLVKNVQFLVRSGAMEEPKWLDLVLRCARAIAAGRRGGREEGGRGEGGKGR